MTPILFDTDAILRAFEGTLSAGAANLIEEARAQAALLLSPITAWEIGLLVKKKRIKVPMPVTHFVRTVFAQPGILTATLTPAIAVASTSLPGELHPDPADRILVATAAQYGAQLLTSDRKLHAYAKATKYIRCIRC